jgi:thiamine biosynthesis lipoprotein ApbE
VTKTKERLENFLTQSNNEIKLNERINSGLKQLDKEEKNMLRILSSISKMNKNTKNMSKLSQKLMKGIRFYYNKDESTIKYEEFFFNGMPIPTNIKIKDVTIDSVNICWNIDKNINNKIEFRVEIKQENKNEEFKEVYKGNNTNYKITNLLKNTNYEIRICSIQNGEDGSWTPIIKFTAINFYDSHIVKNIEENEQLIKWI